MLNNEDLKNLVVSLIGFACHWMMEKDIDEQSKQLFAFVQSIVKFAYIRLHI